MRIAVVHGFYRSDVPSGENVAVRAQVGALRDAGHDVTVVAQDSDVRMTRRTWPLEAAATTITGLGPDPSAALREAAPDVVHVHNLFPHFGTRWLAAWDGPLVATMHTFRPFCAAGSLTRGGRRCTECVDSSPLAGVRHGCYRSSRIATLPLAVAQRSGAAGHPVIARADRLIAISPRAVDEFVRAGIDAGRFSVVPNFVAPAAPATPGPERWLYSGRLSPEKGVDTLLAAWPADRRLDVVGDGESAARLRRLASSSVSFLGGRRHAEVLDMVGRYTGLLLPSQWPEAGPPLTYLEALAAGTPTIAFAGNGGADDVARRGTGSVVAREPTTAELAAALDDVAARRVALSARCRAVAEQVYGAAAWVAATIDVYRDAGAADPGRRAAS